MAGVPVVESGAVTVYEGDCVEVLRGMPDGSVHSVVTDPPYGLEFMGKDWDAPWKSSGDVVPDPASVGGFQDGAGGNPYSRSRVRYGVGAGYQDWCTAWAAECLRVLKPGGHLLAFGGSRTYHRLACGIEDAGFDIRDSIVWLYGSGFPKSHNIGEGWGTALKPAHEPIVVARKPFKGTVAGNVAEYGTGALNIDACRVPTTDSWAGTRTTALGVLNDDGWQPSTQNYGPHSSGRWPPNVTLTHSAECGEGVCAAGCPVAELDMESGDTISTDRPRRNSARAHNRTASMGKSVADWTSAGHSDSGGASRYFPVFRWQPKAPTRERPRIDGVVHPTVKPLELVRWLIRLVTPSDGVVLDPFIGSGTTAEAAILENVGCVGVEREVEYTPLIAERVHRAGLAYA